MADLDHFPDRTISKARERFTDGKRGSGDDPIATHAKVAQDVMLGHLRALIARAESGDTFEQEVTGSGPAAGLQGEVDGDSLIDPFLSYDENVGLIRERFGVNFQTYERAEREAEAAAADERARRHARDTLRSNREAIEAGEADELVQDIADEYGRDFVAEVLGRERERLEAEPAGAPEPSEPEPEPAEPIGAGEADEPEPEPAEQATLADAPEPEPEPAEPERAPASVPSPAATSAPEPEPMAASVSAEFAALGRDLVDSVKTSAKIVALAFAQEARRNL